MNNKYDNIKLRNKAISLITSVVLSTTGYSVLKDNDYFTKAHASEMDETLVDDNFNKGDSVKSTAKVNMRLGTSTSTLKIGLVPKNRVVDRIISLNGFDLIRYQDQLAFVSSEYTTSDVADNNDEYYYVLEDNDIVRTTTKVHFRLGPSKQEKDICVLKKNAELVVIGKSISYTDEEDVWYLAKYQDKIGFVKAEFTTSLKERFQQIDPSITNIKIQKMGYLNNDSPFYNYQNNIVDNIEEYQLVRIIAEKDDNYLVEYNNLIGLISKENVNEYEGTFVVVDLSDQEVSLYCETDKVFESGCTTGSDLTPTRVGSFSIYEKSNSRVFSKQAQAKYLWANFDHGNGLHDAPWESPSGFGNEKYRKKHGSKGCVRLPDATAIYIKKYIKKGTKVLVKK